jgi:5'-nucleotidase
MSKPKNALLIAIVLLWSVATPAHALNILLTNDDGFEAANLHALYQRLKANGHDVIISAPALDNTAESGALHLAAPAGRLSVASRGGSIPVGAPGVGNLASDPDVYYVQSTPVVSMLHGLDIVARRKWGKPPDLVISGVNYGLNTGVATAFSGTFNAAIAALVRGVPAISVSAAYPSRAYRPFTALAAGDRDYEIAELVVRLVRALEIAHRPPGSPLLPQLTGLNVNLPLFEPGAGAKLQVRPARVGLDSFGTPTFAMNLAESTAARPAAPALPGVLLTPPEQSAGLISRVVDADPSAEQKVIAAGAVAISVVQATHEAHPWIDYAVKQTLHELFVQH